MSDKIEYVSDYELTKIFRGLRLGSLANWRTARKGPRFYRFGRKVFYRVDDVKRFLEDNAIKTLDQK